MKKILVIIFLFLIFAGNVFSTQQQPDIIFYNNMECQLQTSWAYPSPLEVYFHQTGKKYPFQELHTANYRGHIATWEIKGDALFLKRIGIEKKEKSLNDIFSEKAGKNMVKAVWFTGMILIKKGEHKKYIGDSKRYTIAYTAYIFADVKNGMVTKATSLSEKEYQDAINCYWQKKKCNNDSRQFEIINRFHEYTGRFQDKQE